jgi:hypothetical protein
MLLAAHNRLTGELQARILDSLYLRHALAPLARTLIKSLFEHFCANSGQPAPSCGRFLGVLECHEQKANVCFCCAVPPAAQGVKGEDVANIFLSFSAFHGYFMANTRRT